MNKIDMKDVELHCGGCGYKGDPTLICKQDPLNPDEIIADAGCPVCQNDRFSSLRLKEQKPQSLTDMLAAQLAYGDTERAKSIFTEWLLTVGLPDSIATAAIRRILVTLIDEP